VSAAFYGALVPVFGVLLEDFKKRESDGILRVRCSVNACRRKIAQLLKKCRAPDPASPFSRLHDMGVDAPQDTRLV
jgi:hypothetical protein